MRGSRMERDLAGVSLPIPPKYKASPYDSDGY